jgi:hypothetical protein
MQAPPSRLGGPRRPGLQVTTQSDSTTQEASATSECAPHNNFDYDGPASAWIAVCTTATGSVAPLTYRAQGFQPNVSGLQNQDTRQALQQGHGSSARQECCRAGWHAQLRHAHALQAAVSDEEECCRTRLACTPAAADDGKEAPQQEPLPVRRCTLQASKKTAGAPSNTGPGARGWWPHHTCHTCHTWSSLQCRPQYSCCPCCQEAARAARPCRWH